MPVDAYMEIDNFRRAEGHMAELYDPHRPKARTGSHRRGPSPLYKAVGLSVQARTAARSVWYACQTPGRTGT